MWTLWGGLYSPRTRFHAGPAASKGVPRGGPQARIGRPARPPEYSCGFRQYTLALLQRNPSRDCGEFLILRPRRPKILSHSGHMPLDPPGWKTQIGGGPLE